MYRRALLQWLQLLWHKGRLSGWTMGNMHGMLARKISRAMHRNFPSYRDWFEEKQNVFTYI